MNPATLAQLTQEVDKLLQAETFLPQETLPATASRQNWIGKIKATTLNDFTTRRPYRVLPISDTNFYLSIVRSRIELGIYTPELAPISSKASTIQKTRWGQQFNQQKEAGRQQFNHDLLLAHGLTHNRLAEEILTLLWAECEGAEKPFVQVEKCFAPLADFIIVISQRRAEKTKENLLSKKAHIKTPVAA